jgi:N-acetylmuramoyl-L-alanine amidase
MKGLKFLFLIAFFSLFFSFSAEAATPVKILLVPGHDNEIWGAQYGNVKEAAMNLAVAQRVYNALKKDKRFEVHITRNTEGYTKEFADYFATERQNIITFRDNAKKETQGKIQNGDFLEKENVPHNNVTEDVSVILYGINKWASDNKMDAVLHIHFNDYPRDDKWEVGKHKGFAIYMPDHQLENGFESGQLAANLYIQLDKKYNSSTYEPELGGLVREQKLIAIGANHTLAPSVRSVLVEYGYIYEKIFRKYGTRHQAYNDMAKATAQGIKNYFKIK